MLVLNHNRRADRGSHALRPLHISGVLTSERLLVVVQMQASDEHDGGGAQLAYNYVGRRPGQALASQANAKGPGIAFNAVMVADPSSPEFL